MREVRSSQSALERPQLSRRRTCRRSFGRTEVGLEIGPGFGKDGSLLRELLDLKAGPHGGYAPFQRRIDAIEVDERYLTPVHSYVCDEVLVGDASKVLASLPRGYDLVLIVDVMEHFPKVPAFELTMAAMKVTRSLVIATPYHYHPQRVVFDNPHEEPLCGFFPSEPRDGGATSMWRKGLGLIAMFTQHAAQLPPAPATGDGPRMDGRSRGALTPATTVLRPVTPVEQSYALGAVARRRCNMLASPRCDACLARAQRLSFALWARVARSASSRHLA